MYPNGYPPSSGYPSAPHGTPLPNGHGFYVFQTIAPRPTTPQNQYQPPMPTHPSQGHYPPMFQAQGMFYPPTNTPQQSIKAAPNTTPQQRESRRLAIIDPQTGKNVLDDVSKENSVKPDKTPTPPTQSSEASASSTPAPDPMPALEKPDCNAKFSC